jgi:hypothetical protein
MAMDLLAPSFAQLENEAFLEQAYQTLLGRTADASGLKDYLYRLNAGATRGQILKELANSAEAQRFNLRQTGNAVAQDPQSRPPAQAGVAVTPLSDLLMLNGDDFVLKAFRSVLGRQADRVGAQFFLQQLEAGNSKTSVIADMSDSLEGKALSSKLPGLADWLKLSRQHSSVAELMALQGDLFVIGAYVVMFKREPDPEGFARYIGLLRSGCSKSFILAALYDSPEAREKSANLPGLASMLALYKKGQRRSWRGWYCRQVLGAESDLPAEQERRALAHLLIERCAQ